MLNLGRRMRERTFSRMKEEVTFSGPGTFSFVPQYGRTLFTVSGRGGTGLSTSVTKTVTYNNHYTRRDNGEVDFTTSSGPWSNFSATHPGLSWPTGSPPADYCDPLNQLSVAESAIYSSHLRCYEFSESGGSSSTGDSFSAFGVTFPGGHGGTAPTIGETMVSIPFLNQGYNIVLPFGAMLTIRNK